MARVITVASNGRDITIQPTRIWVQSGQGNQEILWNVAGNGTVEITKIQFDTPGSPITNIGRVPGTNDWKGTNDTDTDGIFKYTITLKVNGTALAPLDPEVENGPPGGAECADR